MEGTIIIHTIETIEDSLDDATFHPMISILKRMPDDYDHKYQSYPEIRQHLEQRVAAKDAVLFAVRQKQFGNVVGLAGVTLQDDLMYGKTALVTEMAVAPRASGNQLGALLVKECIEWSKNHDADHLMIAVSPEEGSTADELLRELDFQQSADGQLTLQLTEPEPSRDSYRITY